MINLERTNNGMPTIGDIVAGVGLVAMLPVTWIILEIIQVLARP